MSTATAPAAASGARRTLNVVRMQLVNRQTFVWVPLMVLGGALVISILIWALIPYDGPKYGGGAQAPMWYFGVVGAQALTATFPFSQAMSLTRRQFFAGTMLVAMGTALVLGVIFVLGGWFELAAGGWWVNGYFFHLDWVWVDGAFGALALVFALSMLFFLVGFTAATIYKRAGTAAVVITSLAVALLLLAGLWVIGQLNAWAEFFGWFAAQGPLSLAALLIAIDAALTIVSYSVLRRAIP